MFEVIAQQKLECQRRKRSDADGRSRDTANEPVDDTAKQVYFRDSEEPRR